MSRVFASFVVVCALIAQIEGLSVFRIGARVQGDSLLMYDRLNSPTTSTTPTNHTIRFQYPVKQLVSFIEVTSESNVSADLLLSYDDLLSGSATAHNVLEFRLTIAIYGVSRKNAPQHFHSLLTKDVDISGALMPDHNDDNEVDEVDYYENYLEHEKDDRHILFGHRQPGDSLLYEAFQSSDITDHYTNHSVAFYYIDSGSITCAKIVIFEASKTIGEFFSHVSEHSLKALIYDTKTTSLSAKFFLYGYSPEDRPVDYSPKFATVDHGKIASKLQCLMSNSGASLGHKSHFAFISCIGFLMLVLLQWSRE